VAGIKGEAIVRGDVRTRQALMDAGERLIAMSGIEGVNLLAIAREAGQANRYAVQYYFGDRNSLIEAILDERVRWLDQRRSELLDARGDDAGLQDLLEALMLPLAELVDGQGRHIYARFLLQFMIQFERWDGIQHPVRRREEPFAGMRRLTARFRKALPELPDRILLQRLDWMMRLFLSVIVEFDNAPPKSRAEKGLEEYLKEAFSVMASGLRAP
jgi:AcrR family transcriptional regulator